MKVIIAGSRGIVDYATVQGAINASNWVADIAEVVCGCAKGVDRLGHLWARRHRPIIPVSYWPGWTHQKQWSFYHKKPSERVHFPSHLLTAGKLAGFQRNELMAEYADKLIAITNGSSGTAHMISTMRALSKPVFVYHVLVD